MAKIVVYAVAYRGDVHPYVPVATELSRRGHDVTFVVPREFHESFAAEPFRCVHSGSDLSPMELNKHGEWLAKWGMRLGGVFVLRLYFGKLTIPFLEDMHQALMPELDGADVLFAHSTAGIVGSVAADLCGVPWIAGDLFPMLNPTMTQSPVPGVRSLGPVGNRLAWKLARSPRPNGLSFARDFADFRRSKGLDAPLLGPMVLRISPHLNLGMASPSYVPVAPDWPDNYVMTGFTHWEDSAGVMPGDLEAFLDRDDDPPLLITLGTLGAATHPERFAAAVEASDRAGARTVSLCSLDETVRRLRGRFDPDRHRAWRFAPLSKVLGRVRGVVHSGSHGTNSMALAAGLPAVVMPSIFDQLWHAQRQEELGTGIHVKRTDELAGAVTRLLTDDALATNAAEIGQQLQTERGTEKTADHIEGFL